MEKGSVERSEMASGQVAAVQILVDVVYLGFVPVNEEGDAEDDSEAYFAMVDLTVEFADVADCVAVVAVESADEIHVEIDLAAVRDAAKVENVALAAEIVAAWTLVVVIVALSVVATRVEAESVKIAETVVVLASVEPVAGSGSGSGTLVENAWVAAVDQARDATVKWADVAGMDEWDVDEAVVKVEYEYPEVEAEEEQENVECYPKKEEQEDDGMRFHRDLEK